MHDQRQLIQNVLIFLVATLVSACSEPTIHGAAAQGDVVVLQELLANGASVDARDEKEWTALHYAAANSAINAIDVLLQAGADVAAVAQQGFMPLHVAVVEADLATVRRLAEAGAPLDALALDGVTPEVLARRRGDTKIADYLESVSRD